MRQALGHRSRGMVLVIVLWIVTLLSVMAGGFAYSMRIETQLATSTVERAQARALTEAAVAYALAWQLDAQAQQQQQWPANGDVRDWSFGGGRVRIRVEDAAGRVSLNNADPRFLRAVLLKIGVAEAEVDHLVAAIEDWRDGDDQVRPNGAESLEYRAAGQPGPKNGGFESLDELQQVLGIDREIAQRLTEIATTETRISGINPALASFAVLQAATGLDEPAITDYIAARARAAREGTPPPPLPPSDGLSFFSGSRSSVYHIAVTAETASGTTVAAEAIASTRNPPKGQAVRWLSWRLGR
ncbi:MAG: general secretion pathway protein GspK [Gammaproteobacteria bacterium]|nr:general secretion pathway protein GspK [Gammaproteobacteria bacterium]MCP5195269.1 general secretion pathway protein GspK [Gammaproteobacteria bacterium]